MDIPAVTLFAVKGPAGCGKTSRLMTALEARLIEAPLQGGQRVLALTFMHGARRRLNERLRSLASLRNRYECVTIDSFAWRLHKRWRGLVSALGLQPANANDFDGQCHAAGALLERPEVLGWAAASFPIIVVDEGQDLRPQRLRMIQALTRSANVLIAADEFQCLDAALRPNPATRWLREACQPEILAQVRRTNVQGILDAANVTRGGGAPRDGRGFRILSSRGIGMAAAYLANGIAWRGGGDVAVITPALQGGFALNVVQQVCRQACGRQGNGPYAIRWEQSDSVEVADLVASLNLRAVTPVVEICATLDRLPPSGLSRAVRSWTLRQLHVAGRQELGQPEIEAAIARQIALRRQRVGADAYSLTAMTVQQAKNREFDSVFVIWPFQVGGDAEHKRRLLYNAITRARRSCTVITQSPNLLQEAPFF